MSEDERVAWLRERITVRLEAAKAAPKGPWRADGHGCCVSSDEDFIAETSCQSSWQAMLPGGPRAAAVTHIAANDPQQVIADCEMQLGILGLYELWAGRLSPQSAYPELGAAACVASDALRHVASAYRHLPGYAEHWGEPE